MTYLRSWLGGLLVCVWILCCFFSSFSEASRHKRNRRKRDNIVLFPDTRERPNNAKRSMDLNPPEDGTNHKPDGKHGNRHDDVIWVDRGPGSHAFASDPSAHVPHRRATDLNPPEDGTNHKPDGRHGNRHDDVIWVDRGPGSHRGGNSSGRARRQLATSPNIIEMLLIVDNRAFRRYLARNGGNVQGAMAEVTRYYAGVVQAVNNRQAKIDGSGFSLRTVITKLLIMTQPSTWVTGGLDSNGDGRIDSYVALDRMEALSRQVQYIYPHDFLMLMTGYDMYTPRGSNIVGITYGDSICTREGIGLVEDDGDEQMAATFAHELSHSIGAGHDNEDNPCSNLYFVMAPSTGVPRQRSQARNPFLFTECSKTEIRRFLANSYTGCLRTRKTPVGSELNIAGLTQIPLGQLYNADMQCVNTYGPGSRFCREQYSSADFTFADMCYRLRCQVPGGSGCTSTLPFYGTSCGSKMWCQEGLCVTDVRAPPAVSPTCPQGDDPTAQCNINLCPISIFRVYRCCATCAGF